MNDVKNSRLYKALKKAVRKEDHAELLRMLEMVPDKTLWGPGFHANNLDDAMCWEKTPQGKDYWRELHCSITGESQDDYM